MRCVRQIALLKLWERQRGDHQLPAFSDFKNDDVSRFLEGLLIVSVSTTAIQEERFHVLYSGEQFERMNTRTLIGLPLQQAVKSELAGQALTDYAEVAGSKAPLFSLLSIQSQKSVDVKYERLLLPFRSAGEDVAMIVGTVTLISEDNDFNPRDIAPFPFL